MYLSKSLIACFFFLGLFLISQQASAQQRTIKADGLEIIFVTDYDFVYNDRGTGASKNWSMWKPKLPVGFSALGHYAHASHGKPTSVMIAVRGLDHNAVAYPTDYRLVYHDGGTGGDQDGSIWLPIAPRGYKALGMVGMGNHSKPAKETVVCIREDLTTIAPVGSRLFTDSGSGGDLDLSVYRIKPPSVAQDNKESFVTSGSFAAHASYSALTSSEVCSALKVKLPHKDKQFTNTKPKQTSLGRPNKETTLKLATVAQIPCISIVDADYANNLAGQVRSTPIYTLERYDYYKLQDFNTNDSPKDGLMTFSQTTGMTEAHSKSISHTFGVSMSRDLSVEAGPVSSSMSVTLSYALSQSSSYSTSIMEQKTLEKQFSVPAGGSGAYYTLSHVYKLKRANGQVIKTWGLTTPYGHFTAYTPSSQTRPTGNNTSSGQLKIGDSHRGGIVFYVDASGQHGLVCQTRDLGSMDWAEAVRACRNLGNGWRLPTRRELDYMYLNLHKRGRGDFADEYYWSSSDQGSNENVWDQDFDDGEPNFGGKEGYDEQVRAVRKF